MTVTLTGDTSTVLSGTPFGLCSPGPCFANPGSATVNVSGVGDKDNLEPLRSMARPREPDPVRPRVDAWDRPIGPFQFARATAKPKTVVESSERSFR